MLDHREIQSRRTSAAMFSVAAVVFLLTALLGNTNGDAAFFVLSMVFVVLAGNTWNSAKQD